MPPAHPIKHGGAFARGCQLRALRLRARRLRLRTPTAPTLGAAGRDASDSGRHQVRRLRLRGGQRYDRETGIWRERRIPVYPALGNHDLHGDLTVALNNYFTRFPALRHNRFYSVRGANWIMLTLDSALDESEGPQGRWLHYRLNHLPAGTAFVFIVLHHPPYTSSSDEKTFGGGHSARPAEQKMAAYLEQKQKTLRARIVVFAGHVHNYERHEHSGVTYFVTGGGGAHAYPITRAAGDPYQSSEINYHYLLVEIRRHSVKATMNRLELKDGVATWTEPDSVTISSTQALSVAKETAAK